MSKNRKENKNRSTGKNENNNNKMENTKKQIDLATVLSYILQAELVIGAVVVFWYTIVYAYQLGVKNYYQIPRYYIEMDLNRLLEPGFYLIFFFLIAFILIYIVQNTAIDTTGKKKYIYPAIFSVLSSMIIIQTLDHTFYSYMVAAVIVLNVFLLITFLNHAYIIRGMVYVIILEVLFSLSYFTGNFISANKADYYFIVEEKEGKRVETNKVVLDTYKDNYLVARLSSDRTFKPEFELVGQKEDEKSQIIVMGEKSQNREEQKEEKTVKLILKKTGTISPSPLEYFK